MKKALVLFVSLVLIAISVYSQPRKREMRAAWIATVANIDWPSQRNLTTKQQRDEMRNMLDQLAANNINTIILQIRPTADAFYPSQLEPWSHWLTNGQGNRPTPYYDPLQFTIEEAHKRCMDVHVWLNPYRVTNGDNINLLSKKHLYYKNRNLFLKYGGKYYFDPGLDETREFLNLVVEDIVSRYDVDAIHFDDYFYPYKVENEEFPDDATFKAYPRGYTNKSDWRRNNVNMVITELQNTIKSLKPWVEFGISPFGVWRNNDVDPKGSATKAGVQNYDDLYADILKWLQEGSIDYVAPQLYWEIGKKVADYKILIKWWSENSFNKNLYIGLYASALENPKAEAWKKPNEICRQLKMNEQYSNVDGAMFFSAKPFLKNIQGLNDSLKNNYYRYAALTPVNRNIISEPSAQPQNLRTIKDGKDAYLVWDEVNEEGGCAVAYYVVYAFKGKKTGDLNNPEFILTKTTDHYISLNDYESKLKGNYTFVVTSVNKFKQESVARYGVTRKL